MEFIINETPWVNVDFITYPCPNPDGVNVYVNAVSKLAPKITTPRLKKEIVPKITTPITN